MDTKNMLIWSYSICSLLAVGSSAEQNLIHFHEGFDIGNVETQDSKVRLLPEAKALHISTGHSAKWPGITLKAPEGKWDLSSHQSLAIDIKNTGSDQITVFCRVDNPGADGMENCITGRITLSPGACKTLKIPLMRKLPAELDSKLFGMRGYPGGLKKEDVIDPSEIVQIIVFLSNPKKDHVFQIGNLQALGGYNPPEWLSMSADEFFPMIDEYGQFIHKDWINKIHSDADLERHKNGEEEDISKHPGPGDWNIYGGWQKGPKLEATGYFHAEKYKDKWWLVDPEGKLFWSHGIDCVHQSNATTPITDREYLYKDLPDEDSPFAEFYGSASWAPHGYYKDKSSYRTYNFTASNLLRKYGESWKQDSAELAHLRLKSWGMNTIANWSSHEIYLMRKTPYVVSVGFGGRKLEGSEGYWGKFRDVFDASFKEELHKAMSWQKNRSAGDPWCIGYFVDNEIAWGDDVSLAIAALVSPPDQPAKKVFIEDLKAKYGTIDNLNKVWGTQHESWDALLKCQDAPDRVKAEEDLGNFYTKTAETYFKTCRDAVKEFAPDNLYLGCRFAWANERAVRAALKYCDVVSYNIYSREVTGLKLPDGFDKPIIVGEFHFGALDRGMFHTGLQPTENQNERAAAYRNYVLGALKHPLFVGTHWFQYGDQATTGRGDGENYQIGFLDVADTPYNETIQACREVGYNMYNYRLNN
jgi:hypothetical protein